MSDLVAIAYPNLETAREVAQNVGQAQKAHLIELDDMVIAEHRNDGKLKLHQPSLAGVGAAGGALWGGLIGLIFFAPLFGMAIGAASGALAGKMTDSGVDDNFMKNLAASSSRARRPLILLVRQANTDKILAEVKIPGEVIQTLPAERDRGSAQGRAREGRQRRVGTAQRRRNGPGGAPPARRFVVPAVRSGAAAAPARRPRAARTRRACGRCSSRAS